MIKINYKNAEDNESKDDISIHNIKESYKYKKNDYIEISCIAWLKNDITRDFQHLEDLLRKLNIDLYIIAQPINDIPNNVVISYPNDKIITEPLLYIAKIINKSREEVLKEIELIHNSYMDNFECLKKTGCLMINNKSKDNMIESNIQSNLELYQNNLIENNEIKKVLASELKINCEYLKTNESINFIIEDIIRKYGKNPEKIACGEINGNKVNALMINNQIVSPIGWIENENIMDSNNEKVYELIDFRNIKVEK